MNVTIRLLEAEDIEYIASFQPDEERRLRREQIYRRYFQEQERDERVLLLAFLDEKYVGRITIIWHPDYPPFAEQNIPEISDMSVLPDFRRRGIGSLLMDEAERRIFERSDITGIGFGISADYGPAQRMYVKRGYLPDGQGLWNSEEGCYIWEFASIRVDDCVIFLTRNRE